MAPPEPTDADPLRIGRYEVISHLATGGMAQIYLARQSGLGSFERHVVLKTILRERAADQRFVTMFLDEAKLAATLNHQNVAQVYEVDHADGAYFMAMEYVHGENTRAILETTIRRGWTIPLELAVMIISGAAAGLHHAHERRGKNGQPLQIVHRDVSPANIMVGYDGSIKVLDFGIAKAEERATKTIGGTIKGKYGYMSPEQCKGKPIDRRSDIFALGIVLYELGTLRRAFKGNDDFETMKRIVAGDLVLPSTLIPGFPRELEAIILTALASDPAARFQTAQELIEALDAFTVRAKLTGSNTAMGRFMVQLFGTKKEPWIDATLQSTDHTLVTQAELADEDDDDHDNDETLVVGNRHDVQRVLAELNAPVARQPTPAQPVPVVPRPGPTEPPPMRGAPTEPPPMRGAPTEPPPMRAAPIDSDPTLPRPGRGPTPRDLAAPIDPMPSSVSDRARRPSVRRTGERPSLPFSGTPAPSLERAAAAATGPADRKTAPMPPPGTAERNRPSNPNLAMTVIGPVPLTPEAAPPPHAPVAMPSAAMPVEPLSAVGLSSGPLSSIMPVPPVPMPPVTMPPATMPPTAMPPIPMPAPPLPMPAPPNLLPPGAQPLPPGVPPSGPVSVRALAPSGLPALGLVDEYSQVGSRSLVTDPKLGWSTSVKLPPAHDGSSTRLPSDVIDVQIQSNTRWVVLSIVLVLVVAAMVILIIET